MLENHIHKETQIIGITREQEKEEVYERVVFEGDRTRAKYEGYRKSGKGLQLSHDIVNSAHTV